MNRKNAVRAMPNVTTSTDDTERLAPLVLDIRIDRNSGVPLYQQISEPLQEAIMNGQLPPGRLIEDEISMARRLEVSRPTARRALQDLVARGLLTRRRGIGTVVTPSQVHRPFGLTSLEEDLRQAGFETRTEVVSYEHLLAGPEESQRLGCRAGTEIVRVVRTRWISGKPLAVLTNLIPVEYAPSVIELTRDGLYHAFRERGIQMATGQQQVSAKNADSEEASLLQISPGDAVLTMKRWVYDNAGTTIEFGDHVYEPSNYTLNFASTIQ